MHRFAPPLHTPLTRLLIALLALILAAPAVAQSKGDKWVATWATALVSRPLPAPRAGGPGGPPAPAPGPASGPAAAPAAAPPAPPAPAPGAAPAGPGGGRGFVPPATVNNQTLRQVVHTSIGGGRVRVHRPACPRGGRRGPGRRRGPHGSAHVGAPLPGRHGSNAGGGAAGAAPVPAMVFGSGTWSVVTAAAGGQVVTPVFTTCQYTTNGFGTFVSTSKSSLMPFGSGGGLLPKGVGRKPFRR